MFNSPALQRLCDEIIDERLVRVAPADEATLTRWRENDADYANEGFVVKAFDPADDQLIVDAIGEWNKRESCIVRPLRIQGAGFNRLFHLMVKNFYKNQEGYPWGTKCAHALSFSSEIVRNIEWVRAFCFFLPKYAPHRKKEIAQTAYRMAAIFYLEQMDKWFRRYGDGTPHLSDFSKIDAYWRFAVEQYRQTKELSCK